MLNGHVFKKQRFGNHMFALFMDLLLDGGCGIDSKYRNSMNLSYSGSNITINSGAICIRGRLLEEDSSTTIEAGTNTLFCKLVVEVDLDKENTESEFVQGSYKILVGELDYPSLTQQDIVKNNAGKYQYELARFKTGLSGISNFVDKRTFIDFDSVRAELNKKFDKAGGTVSGNTTFTDGVFINSKGLGGGLEMFGDSPYMDFHTRNSSLDYTNRIVTCFNKPGLMQTGYQMHLVGKGGIFATEGFGESSGDNPFFGAYRSINNTIIGSCSNGCNIRDINDGNISRPIGASKFNEESSRRYKKNIEDMTEEEANKLDDIRVVMFDYKIEENGAGIGGVIAEETYEVLPSVVTLADIDGKMIPDSVAYSRFVAYLIKRDQMKSKKIAELEERISKLEMKE